MLKAPARPFRALLAVPFALSPAVAADPASQRVRDFDLGGTVGACLVVKCQVFRGALLTEAPKAGDPVQIRVREWLFGDPVPSETLAVPYDDKPNRRGLGGTSAAWRNAKPSWGATATVLMALETSAEVVAGEPVLVTFDEREGTLIRSLTDEASQLKRTPDLISAEVASLSASSSPVLAGYLLHYVLFSKDITQRGLAAELLIQALGSPGIPAERWGDIPFFLLAHSGSLPPEGRVRMIRRFIDLAQLEDDNAASAGFAGLGGVAIQPENGLRALIGPAALSRLGIRYRALVGKNKISRNTLLESLLAARQKTNASGAWACSQCSVLSLGSGNQAVQVWGSSYGTSNSMQYNPHN
jgi:hypothetical protein